MLKLPIWNIPATNPVRFDIESLTPLEVSARLYDAVNQLITEYNNTVGHISEFEKTEQECREEFETKLTKVVMEFMCSWEQKTEDLTMFAETIINEAIQAGTITITEVYDPDTESLNMGVGGEA